MRSSGDGKAKVSEISGGVKITYTFKKAGITIPVTYKLEDDYLEARVKTADIEEQDTSQETGKLTTSISIMSNFGAASSEDEGYFVIPDGSGALIRFNNGKTTAKSYTGYVYGSDLTAVALKEPAVTEQVYLPMCGIVNGDNAMMVVCTEGDSNAKLTASVSGQSNSSYNVCGFDFTIRDSDSYYMSGDNSTALTVFEDGPIKTDTIALRYYPLDTADTPDYTDVAAAYRNYLTEECGVESTVDSADPALSLDLYGGVEKEKSVLGIPVNLKTSLTSYDQAQEILKDLNANGVSDISVQYHNWTNAGITGKVDVKAKGARCLGGNGDWNDLQSYAASNGITIYPTVDNRTFVSGSGYYTFTDTTVRISGSYARIYDYDLAYGTQSQTQDPLSLLSPAAFRDVYSDLVKNYGKKDLHAVSLGSMMSSLYGDYGKKAISRDSAQTILEESYQSLRDAFISLMADTANAYALLYVDEITDVPLQSSGFDVFDEDIPFYQLVMHGPFVGMDNYNYAFNVDPNYRQYLLKVLKDTAWKTPLILVFSLFVAVILNQKFKGRTFSRAVFFLPVIIATGPVYNIINGNLQSTGNSDASQFSTMFSTDLLGDLMQFLGIYGISDGMQATIETVSDNIFGIVWNSGIQILIFLAALQNIPVSAKEAAQMEGATAWEYFWKITLPYVSPREQIVWMEAGCLISILPILIMYVFLQKYFTEGIERSGLVG